MFVTLAVAVCLQTLFVQGLSAQCVGAYNGLAAEGWPVSNAYAWEVASPFGAASPCAGSPYTAASWAAAPYAANEWGAGYSPAALAASNGGGLAISSASPIAPNGVAMNSENKYEGPLAVSGAMPFLGAVALEGALPSSGAGAVSYGCGNGNVAIINEDYAAGYGVGAVSYGAGIGPGNGYNGFAGPVAMEAGIAGQAFGYNRFGGCGCGAF